MTQSSHTVTGRVAVLRPWTFSDRDIASVIRAHAAPDMAGQSARPITDAAGARTWLDVMVPRAEVREPTAEEAQDQGPDPVTLQALAIDVDGVAVGHVMVSGMEWRHQTGWVSYWVEPSARGQRLASAAVVALAGTCFRTWGLYRLELVHRLNNPASGAVAAAAGFIREGVERQKLRYQDDGGAWERFDTALWARLATDPSPETVPLDILPG